MSKINNKIAAFIFFLTLALLFGLAIKSSIDMIKETQTPKTAGLDIQFENGTTEPEVKSILKNYNVPVSYTIDYDSDYMLKRYYITIDQDKRMDVINELKKEKNLTYHTEIKKGNYSIIILPEEFIPNKKFLTMLEKNNLQLKKSINCYIHFRDESNYWIPEKDAVRIKNELEINEKVLIVSLDNLKY
ncbi:MAG: hypothetical protein GX152_07320 [Methanosarcina sp.]|nr:hypothetical protein [Methanosarcina sp.]